MSGFDSFGFYEDLPMMDPGVGEGMEFFTTFMVIYLVFMLLSLAYSVLVYVLQSLGTYTIAKRRGIHNPWLAWLPVANMWTLGSISDQYQYVAKGKVRNRRKVLLGLCIATYALLIPFFVSYVWFIVNGLESAMVAEPELMEILGPALVMLGISVIMMVLAVILTVFQYIAYYDLFVSCNPANAVVFLVLSIIFSFLIPYFVFACRKKDLGMPPRKTQIPVQQVQLAESVVLPEEQDVQPKEPEEQAAEPEALTEEPETQPEAAEEKPAEE